ncbi:hypothetical protein E3U43_007081, partial [Larimichthys crocea]
MSWSRTPDCWRTLCTYLLDYYLSDTWEGCCRGLLQFSSWFTVNGQLPEVSSCIAET